MIITTSYKFVMKSTTIGTHREIHHLPNHRFGISVTILLFGRGTRIYRYRDLFHCECLDDWCIIHILFINRKFQIASSTLFLYRAGNDSHNRNGKRYIVIHISYKMNLISVVIYCYDWIRYLCN